jgi:hypothetical protein
MVKSGSLHDDHITHVLREELGKLRSDVCRALSEIWAEVSTLHSRLSSAGQSPAPIFFSQCLVCRV